MKQKLLNVQQSLNKNIIGRESVIKSALLSLVAGENILLIGPPGTAKSMIARSVSQVIDGGQGGRSNYFEYLLTKFSTPEEIFGPLSISELKQDRFKRNTDGYLPTAQVAFLDEIFKASSSILNALLTILNERKYHNGTHTIDTPLISIISASNELPTDQAELSALYDRFLIRSYVDYLPSEGLSELFNVKNNHENVEKLTINELQHIQKQSENVIFPESIKEAILEIWQKVKDEFKDNTDESLSDRRFVKCLHLMRISAVTNDRTEVGFSDVFLLKDCLWNVPENAEKVTTIILNVLKEYEQSYIKTILGILEAHKQSLKNQAQNQNSANTKPSDVASTSTSTPFKGKGTKHDPFLIENINHLHDLTNDNIAGKGYYFKQVNDLDCSTINKSSWFKIDLVGHYDGNDKKVIYKDVKKYLFNYVRGSVKNITVEGLQLAKQVKNSTITNCHSDTYLFDDIRQSKISHCSSGDTFALFINGGNIEYCKIGRHLATNIQNSHVRYCHAKSVLILEKADKSTIEDCQINIENEIDCDDYQDIGGVSAELGDKSHIRRCYIDGKPMQRMGGYDNIYFSGVADSSFLASSSIKYCAIGKIYKEKIRTGNRIVRYCIENIRHNVSIASNNWGSEKKADGKGGESVSNALFNQHYFENTLGWDFKTVWRWNDDENRPELIFKDIQKSQNDNDIKQNQILVTQMKNNIWLS